MSDAALTMTFAQQFRALQIGVPRHADGVRIPAQSRSAARPRPNLAHPMEVDVTYVIFLDLHCRAALGLLIAPDLLRSA